MWRGRGVYPHLLQAILQHEEYTAKRFCILHAPENLASAGGIRKAGLLSVAELSFVIEGNAGLVPLVGDERAFIGATLLNVPLLPSSASDTLLPC